MTGNVPLLEAEKVLEEVGGKRYRAYSSYRDSGVDWLGKIPNHWATSRGKFIAKINPSSSEIKNAEQVEEVSFVPMEAVGEYGGIRLDLKRDFGEVKNGFTYFRNGDILFAKITPCFENGKGTIAYGLLNGVGFGSTEFHVLRPKSNQNFFFYLTTSQPFRKLGESEMYGAGGQKRVPTRFVKDFQFPCPPNKEQKIIAHFLDTQTQKIDDLISAKRELLALLQEKRQAVITHAVTKGLDPGVPMKPSGVDWLGEVPEHWEIKRLDFLASTKARLGWKGLKAEEYVPEGCLFLSTPNIKGEGPIDFQNVNYITSERYDESPEIKLRVGDVLLAKDGSTLGTTNVVRSLPGPSTVNSSIAVIRPKQAIDSFFLFRWFTSSFVQSTIQRMKDGQGVPHLFQADIRKFVVLLPPKIEQGKISEYLETETAKIDHLSTEVETAIATLQEYRTALISAAVTGKIDVRGEAR